MATSGYTDVKVTSVNTLRFSWWQISQSAANNSTKIGWNLQLIAADGGVIYSSATKNWWTNINGKYSEGTNTVNINNSTTKTLAGGEQDIPHNADGTKTFSYSFSQYFGVNFGGTTVGSVQGNGTGTLEPLAICATLESAPSAITDEQISATITYFNPVESSKLSKLQACIGIGWDVLIPYRDIDPNGTSYTFEFTDEERALLLSAVTSGTSNSNIYFYVGTWTTDGGFYTSRKQTTLNLVDAEPTLEAFIYDSNPLTSELTGNPNERFIRGYSNLSYTMNVTPKKGATIVSKKVESGSYLNTADVGFIQGVDLQNAYLHFSATDSRGNIVQELVPFTYVAEGYIPLWCYNVANSLVTSSGGVSFEVYGEYYSGWFDGTTDGSKGGQKNELILQYRYKLQGAEDEDYTEWTTVEEPEFVYDDVFDDTMNSYQARIPITGLDYTATYTVQVRAIDKLVRGLSIYGENVTVELTINMVPVFDWSKTDFRVNTPVTLKNIVYMDDINTDDEPLEVIGYLENRGNPLGLSIGEDLLNKTYENLPDDARYNLRLNGNNMYLTSYGEMRLDSLYDNIYLSSPVVVDGGIQANGNIALTSVNEDVIIAAVDENTNPTGTITCFANEVQLPDFVTIGNSYLTDFVVDHGDNGSYAYRLWASGKMEAWRIAKSTVTVKSTKTYGSMYYHDGLSLTTTGQASFFKTVDSVQLTINKNNNYGCWQPVLVNHTLSNGAVTVNYLVTNPVKDVECAITPYVHIYGTWR